MILLLASVVLGGEPAGGAVLAPVEGGAPAVGVAAEENRPAEGPAPVEGGGSPAERGLFEVGEPYGEGTVRAVEIHPEYQRITVELAGLTLWEVTTGTGGLCDHDGLTAFPRPELLPGEPPGGADPALLCERLATRPPTLRARVGALPPSPGPASVPAAGSPGTIDTRAATRITWLHGVLIAIVALTMFHLWLGVSLRPGSLRGPSPRAAFLRDAVLTGAALLLRLAFSPHGIVNGDLGGYEKLVFAHGSAEYTPYGLGWGTLMGWVPGWPDGVFTANLVLAVLAAPLAGRIAARLGGPVAGYVAGLLLAALPVHLGVSWSETMHVSVLTLELLAVAAGLAWRGEGRWSDGLLCALSAGFAVHVRPDAILFVPVAAVLLGRRGLPLLVALGALVAARLVGLEPEVASPLQTPGPSLLLPRFGVPVAEQTFLVSLHLGLTPLAYVVLAVLGWAGLGVRRRDGLLLLAWALLTTVPLAGKVFPIVDAIRFQLSGQAPMVIAAGLAAATLPRGVLLLALLAALSLAPRPWVQTEEWHFVRGLALDGPIQFDPGHQRARAWVAVLNGGADGPWTTEPAMYRYIGLTCLSNPECDTSACVEVASHDLQARADVDLPLSSRHLAVCRAGVRH